MATEPGAGLAGIVAGHTAIATVGKEGKGLTYRGYSIYDLAEHSTFEEVAYLLIYGRLPKRAELDEYKAKLRGLRGLPAALKTVLRADSAQRPSDGCDAYRLLDARHAGARRARPRSNRRRQSAYRLASAPCFSTGTNFMKTASASIPKRTTTAPPAISCICSTAKSPTSCTAAPSTSR